MYCTEGGKTHNLTCNAEQQDNIAILNSKTAIRQEKGKS